MAHDGTHPVNEDITGDNPDTADLVETNFVITAAHNAHPVPTISVKTGATVKEINGRTEVMVVATDDDTANGVENEIYLGY